MKKPLLQTVFSPALLHLYDVSNTIVVVIDVLRATSTIATALYNGAREIIPVDSVERCIQLGRELECITAGERDGQVAEGLQYGNSSFEYPREFIEGKTLVLTTTNGTKLLHMALAKGAQEIITGLEKGEFEIHFPKAFTRTLRTLRILPYSLYFAAVRKITANKNKAELGHEQSK